MSDIRIKDQPLDESLSSGDYVVVDSQSEGTRKFDLGTELTAIKEDIAQMGSSVPTSVREAIYNLLNSAAYASTGHTTDIATVQSWAATVTAISLNQSTASVTGTGTVQLVATTTPSGSAVSWSSSDTSIATVSSNGLVTGVANGSVTITATSGDFSATCSVTVSGFTMYTVTNTLTKVLNSNTSASMAQGSSYSATLTPYYGYEFSTVSVTMGGVDITSTAYDDGDISIASVTGDIVITASAAKETNILYAWDFKDSLTDTIEGVTATLANVSLVQGTGVEFTANDPKQCIELGNVFAKGRHIDIYLENVDAQISTVNANMFEMWDGSNDPGTYNAFGWREHNTASYDGWGAICTDVGSWRYAKNTNGNKQNKQLFNGNHKLTISIAASDGLIQIYRDDVNLNMSATPNNDNANDPLHLTTAANATHPIIGSKLYYPNLFDMTVVGVKIFDGGVS